MTSRRDELEAIERKRDFIERVRQTRPGPRLQAVLREVEEELDQREQQLVHPRHLERMT